MYKNQNGYHDIHNHLDHYGDHESKHRKILSRLCLTEKTFSCLCKNKFIQRQNLSLYNIYALEFRLEKYRKIYYKALIKINYLLN